MKSYSIQLNLAGDRNHVVHKHDVSPAEIMVLQAIHGSDAVYEIDLTGSDRLNVEELRTYLVTVYNKVRVGDGNNRQPVLGKVFPAWPNVKFPYDAKEAGVSESLMKREAELSAAQKEALANAAATEKRMKELAEQDASKAEEEAKAEEESAAKAEEEAKAKADEQAKADADNKAKSNKPAGKGKSQSNDDDEFME